MGRWAEFWRRRCSLSPQRGENSPNCSSRFEPLNRSSRRQEALTDLAKQMEPPDVGCYEVHGEGRGQCGEIKSTEPEPRVFPPLIRPAATFSPLRGEGISPRDVFAYAIRGLKSHGYRRASLRDLGVREHVPALVSR